MAGPTKADLRAQLDELGVEQPGKSATRDELLELVAGHVAGDTPQLNSSSPVRNTRRAAPEPAAAGTRGRRVPRCTCGRPLFTDEICRRGYLAGITSHDED